MKIKGKDHQGPMRHLIRFTRRNLKLTYATFVKRLGIFKRIVPEIRLDSKRKVSIMLLYVSNQIWLKFLIILNGLILDVTHVSTIMQGFLTIQPTIPNEKFV